MLKKYALVTLYNPIASVIYNIKQLIPQVDVVFLCDNSTQNNSILFKELKVEYIPNLANLGLSQAFNKILKNKDWEFSDDDYIIFFDQDSCIKENHIEKLIKEYSNLEDNGYKVGCFGPIYHDATTNQTKIARMKKVITPGTYSVTSIITSSMVVKYKVLKQINFWNEQIFLDMADQDLCWRIKKNGFLCCVTEKVVLDHRLGSGFENYFGIKIQKWAPIREYYKTRDRLYLLKYNYVPLKVKLHYLYLLTFGNLLNIILLDNKEERKYYIKRGFLDFNRKIKGEYKK